MKKISTLTFIIVSLVCLTACSSQIDSNERVNETNKQSSIKFSKNSTSYNSKSSDLEKSLSSITTHLSEGAMSDLGQARLALYQAGINSSSLSDDQVLKLWNEAKSLKVDFVEYFQAQNSNSAN